MMNSHTEDPAEKESPIFLIELKRDGQRYFSQMTFDQLYYLVDQSGLTRFVVFDYALGPKDKYDIWINISSIRSIRFSHHKEHNQGVKS